MIPAGTDRIFPDFPLTLPEWGHYTPRKPRMPIHDRPNRRTPSRARLLALAPLTCLLFAAPLLHAGEPVGGLAATEQRRRATNVAEAQELLKKGDQAYQAGKWKDAVAAYSGARDLIPDAPATRELRSSATQRFAQASVERAREQSRHGDVAGAKETVDLVLAKSVAPENPGALQMRAELDDPIRTNPALTKEHAADVEEVRLLLYKADGAYNSGQFDQAERVYQDVLRTDPTNTAARRGMERTAQARTAYYRAAGDHTRAEMLSQVDAAWELAVPPTLEDVPAAGIGGGENTAAKSRIYIGQKLDTIVLASVDFDGVTLTEAIDYLRAQSIQLDVLELDESRRGINFVIEFGADPAKAAALRAQKITLQLRNVPLSQVLKHLCEMTHTSYSAQEWAVTLRPEGADVGDLTSRVFTVPPDFLSVGNGAASSSSAVADDPFASDKKPEGLIAKKMSAEEVLKSKGVPFPQGASASFNSGNSSLRVVNTPTNLALIEQVIDAMSDSAPAMVVVEVKIIRTQEKRLKELGFDMLLSPYSLGGESLVPGIASTFLSGGTRDPANLSDILLPDGMDHADAITSGNRSGAEAIASDSIDDLLQRTTGNPVSTARAPGILSVTSLMNDTGLKAVMRGLDQKKGVSLQACPSTVTRSGEQGVIEISRELIYPTEYEPPELPNSLGGTDQNGDDVAAPPITPVTPSHPGSFKMRNVGVRLEVLPTVDANRNYVDITLKPVVTDFDGFVNFGTPITGQAPGAVSLIPGRSNLAILTPNDILMPVFSVMRVETTSLTLQNGATLVMGGLLQDRIQKVEDHTPILGDIPLVGRLFHSDAYAPVSTAIVFLVTVRIVDPGGRPYTTAGN